MSGLPVLGSTEAWSGGDVSPRLTCVLAPNPSPMTLDGTNTWLIGEPESTMIVVDPGPDDDLHLRTIIERAQGRIVEILLTHGHSDHAAGARSLREMTGAPVRALDPFQALGGEGLRGGSVVTSASVDVHVLATPGHTADCLSFFVAEDSAILTGDTVLGRGTTVVAYPDGNLGDYLESLSLLRDHAAGNAATVLLPGHGPVLPDPVAVIDAYLVHRHARLSQVREARAAGAVSAEDVVAAVYADVPESVRWAALLSTRAQLDYLETEARRES